MGCPAPIPLPKPFLSSRQVIFRIGSEVIFEHHPKVPKPILDDPRGMLIDFQQGLHGNETPSGWLRSDEPRTGFRISCRAFQKSSRRARGPRGDAREAKKHHPRRHTSQQSRSNAYQPQIACTPAGGLPVPRKNKNRISALY
jgi:hypothetical protein